MLKFMRDEAAIIIKALLFLQKYLSCSGAAGDPDATVTKRYMKSTCRENMVGGW